MPKNGYEKFFDLQEIIEKIKTYLEDFDEKEFIEAFKFAEKAHEGQFRKDGITPYLAHPVEVVKILTSLHTDKDTLISALLHDVPEDTSYTINDVKKAFGPTVAFLVDGITKLSKVHYQHNMPERQIESLKKLFLHSGKDFRVILIKLADRLHNMKTLSNIQDPKKRSRIATETLEIYVPIANLLGIQELKWQLEDLCFKYLFPEEYEKIHKKREDGEEKRTESVKEFTKIVEKEAQEQGIKIKVIGKKKNLFSIYKKIRDLGKDIDDVDDRVAVLILVEKVEECYQVLGIVHSNFLPINDRFRDYIANPKMNGYQSLHTTVFGVRGALTEIRISTEQMHFDAEYGITASFINRSQSILDRKKYSWMDKIVDIEKNKKTKDRFLENLKTDILQDRIFVFSPKGTAVDLPKGATILDFAYAIHTDIGNHACKADINGKAKPINTILRTGDVVNVICSRQISPELSWLSFIKTNLARNKILLHLKKISRDKKIKEGKKILQKEFDIVGLGLCENVNFRKLRKLLLNQYAKSFKNLEELFIAVGEGDVRAVDIVKSLNTKNGKDYFENKDEESKKGIEVSLKIMAKNRFGLLRDIADVLYRNVLDMYSLKGWASKYEEDAFFTSELLVADYETVSQLFDELDQIEGVVSVCRISTKGLWTFRIAAAFTALAWIMHPFILKLISVSAFHESYPVVSNVFIYFGLFFLIFIVLYLTSLIQKYFPFARRRKLPWILVFSLPLLATATLFVELFYFKLELSLLVICIEIIVIYAYIVMNYINFRKITRQT